ncbi:MAG: AI-2E family transporter [Acidimicrobiales bacterium]
MAPGLERGEWKRIASITAVVLGVVALFGLAYLLLGAVTRILAYLTVALFFTAVLTPAVDFVQRRGRMRRGLATAIVFVIGFGLLGALTYSFVRPAVDQGSKFADDLPDLLDDARAGRGTVGDLVERFNLENYIDDNTDEFQERLRNFGTPALDVARSIFNGLFAAITILVLTVLMILQGPALGSSALNLLPERHRERVRRVAADAGKAVSGYMAGNLLISVIAGTASYMYLRIAGVPYPEVLALWVAFADLIPLVGATLGAVPTIIFALLHSNAAGIAGIIFFIAYQQFENHVLQVTIMSRTVNVSPLTVLLSVLVGVEMFGLLGAVLAIPAAGVLQVIIRDVWDTRRGRLKHEPTVGEHETPVDAPELS